MDFRRLEAFCKVYERKSFSKAGEDLYLSQPTVSAHIAALEDELGVKLFDRWGRSILPTQAAEILYFRAKDVFEELSLAKIEIALLKDEVAGGIIVGASTIPADYILPQVLAGFIGKHPLVKPTMLVDDSLGVLDRLAAGELSLGIVGVKEERPDFNYEPLLDDKLTLIAPKNMFSDPSEATLGAVLAKPWVLREEGSGTRKAVERALASVGRDVRDLHCAVVAAGTQSALACVKAGLGVTITSMLAAGDLLAQGVVEAFEAPGLSLKRTFYIVQHGRRRPFPATAAFVKHLKREAARIML